MTIRIPRKTYDECEKARTLIPEGQYLLEILDVEGNDASDYLTIKYRTQLPTPGMEGEERFYLSEKALRRFGILVKRAGLQDRGTDASEAIDVDPYDLVGTQWVVKIIHEQATSKKGEEYTVHRWGFSDFWPPDHADVADFIRSLSQRTRPAAPAQVRQTQAAPNGRQTAPIVDDEV